MRRGTGLSLGPGSLRLTPKPHHWLHLLAKPAVILSLTLAVHVAGRVAAVCATSKFDSFVYAVAAYKLYDADATFDDLIPDKPIGQSLLTGWVYRVAPSPPTRLAMIPLESLFMLGGYLFFGLLVWRLFGGAIASALVFLLAVGVNGYNTLDSTVAGLNVNENYMLLPMMLAVWAHLCIARPGSRGFVRGLGIALALSIKQTAAGLLAVLLVHGAIRTCRCRAYRDALCSVLTTLAGMAVVWLPMASFLYHHGWLALHLQALADASRAHAGWSIPYVVWFKLVPVVACLWWIVLGIIIGRGDGPEGSDDPLIGKQTSDVAWFGWCWLIAELIVVVSIQHVRAHYYQLLVPPLVLLAGVGMHRMAVAVRAVSGRQRWRAWRFNIAATVVLVAMAMMALSAETSRRVGTFDYTAEVNEFADWLQTWSPRSLVEPGP